MGHPKTMERLREMSSSEKENCILLLDAFDEDNEAVSNYKKRLDEVLDLVWEFREIVITCRTQFFPSSKSEPTETGKFKFGPEPGQFHFQKIYISVFSEDDIKRYLRKRFKSTLFSNSSRYSKALEIVLKSPNLMMRPMLLSKIDDLITANAEIKHGFQIYATLIDQWLVRESNKAGIVQKYGTSYKQSLYDFSKALARDLYLNRKKRNNKLSLDKGEIIDNPNGLQLKDIDGNQIGIDKDDQGSRSLLNRNAVGEYKFSHKSILEYFLAIEVIENERFREKFYFTPDLDTSKKFFLEMLQFKSETIQGQELGFYFMNLEKVGVFESDLETMKAKKVSELPIYEAFRIFLQSEVSNNKVLIAYIIFLIILGALSLEDSYYLFEATISIDQKEKNGFALVLIMAISVLIFSIAVSLVIRSKKFLNKLSYEELTYWGVLKQYLDFIKRMF